MREITIVGGGLAGLSLGIGLRSRGAAVVIKEAGSYPRHRVCGEFICGVQPSTLEALGLEDALEGATHLGEVAWFLPDRLAFRHGLPLPGRGLSRHHLDLWLAQRFESLGGDLRTHTRGGTGDAVEGTIRCTGRVPDLQSRLMGLKVHLLDFEPEADLEMHCTAAGYIGLCRVEDGRTNASGLFFRNPEVKAPREELQRAYLEACGLHRLCDRMAKARVDPESCAAVTGVPRGYMQSHPDPAECAIGDRFGMIGPFTGNGISMAFESAEVALEPLLRYADGGETWDTTVVAIHHALRRRFRTRLTLSHWLHRTMLHPRGLTGLAKLGERGLLPIPLLFRCLR